MPVKIFKKIERAGFILRRNGVGVMPTDTIYGLVGRALSKRAVLRIYKLRQRNPKKPMIILISSLRDLLLFGIKPDEDLREKLNEFWPGKISIILPCFSEKFVYLHRGTKTLAFRLPAKKSLRSLLQITGPLVAPSANPEGLRPAANIKEAKKYFGNKVDFYVGGDRLKNLSSTLVKMEDNKIVVLRAGAFKFKDKKVK